MTGTPPYCATQRRNSTDLREHLIDCSIRCFHTYGIFQTSIVDVAAAAAVSPQTVLKQFSGRSALLNGVIVRDLEQFWVQSIELLKPYQAYDSYLVEALVSALDYSRKNPDGLISFKAEVRPTLAAAVTTDTDCAYLALKHLPSQLLSRSGPDYQTLDDNLPLIGEWFNRLFASYLAHTSLLAKNTEQLLALIRRMLPAFILSH